MIVLDLPSSNSLVAMMLSLSMVLTADNSYMNYNKIFQLQDRGGDLSQKGETPRDEVTRLLRDHQQNRELIRRLGKRYYQVVYPIQVRHREKMGVSTREIDSRNPQGGVDGRGVNELEPNRQPPRQQKHYRQTSLLIKAFQHRFRLDLELNTRLIAPNVQKKVFLPGGATATSTSAVQDVEQCYYHGVVKDWQGGEFIPGSMAALQTCNGVSGIIHLGNETFVIHPFYGGDLSSKHPHIIYESIEKPHQHCGVLDNQLRSSGTRSRREALQEHAHGEETDEVISSEYRNHKLSSPRTAENNVSWARTRRDVRYVPKFVETALVLDKAMFDNRPGLSRRDVIHESIQVANIADLYFKTSLKTRLSIVYLETWEDQDQAGGISKQLEINKALDDLSSYAQRKLHNIEKDTTQMFTGRNSFSRGETTTASVGRICTERSVGISVDVNPFEPHILASNLAHAIGHNLGFGHDDSSAAHVGGEMCTCADWHGCIMKSSLSGEDGIQPFKFSECSFKQFQRGMEKGSALCLLNRPSEINSIYGTCGNGVIDDNEDCDCGSEPGCESDPCCSPITCKLKHDAECASGPCCEYCKLKPQGSLCREPASDCDLGEFCSGKSGECPSDLYIKNGKTCMDTNGEQGFCFNGDCPTRTKQCQDLWGHGAEPAENYCYESHNTLGTANGNCGQFNKYKYAEEMDFKKCSRSDVMCGTLHCQGGMDTPILTSGATGLSSTNTQDYHENRHIQCKSVSRGLDKGSLFYMGIVKDGVKCGDNRICMNQTCVDLAPMSRHTKCPESIPPHGGRPVECSTNGKCSNINTCVCDPGWSGIDCSMPVAWSPTAPPRLPPPRPTQAQQGATPPPEEPTKSHTHVLKESDSDTIIMVIFLVLGVGGIFILFAIMALCYRRKSALPKYEPPYIKRPMAGPGPGGPAAKGYSHPNSPHPSQAHMTPDHSYPDNDNGGKMMSYAPTPTYRSVEEHGMKRMGNHGGSIGSQHQIQGGLGQSQIMGSGSGQNLMSESYQQGILKKSPYCPIDKDRWDERMSSSSQNNLVNLTSGHSTMGPRSDSRRDISDVERTLKSLNGYHEDILEALRDAASGRAGGGPGSHSVHPGYSTLDTAPVLTEELKRHLAETRAVSEYRSQQELRQQTRDRQEKLERESSQHALDSDEMGPIRIRNLEDLIRQLEHSSNRHMSPAGSEDVRMSSETEADRHFRSPVGHCSSADRYFQSLHSHGCDIPGLDRHQDPGPHPAHRQDMEDGSESDSIESIYKKLSTPKRADSRTGSRGSSIRGGRPLPSPHEFQ